MGTGKTMWQCGTVAVAMWQCGTVALWRCGAVALWRCGTGCGCGCGCAWRFVLKIIARIQGSPLSLSICKLIEKSKNPPFDCFNISGECSKGGPLVLFYNFENNQRVDPWNIL